MTIRRMTFVQKRRKHAKMIKVPSKKQNQSGNCND